MSAKGRVMSGLKILSILPSATIQDQGRVGYLRFGVTSSGAMDAYALAEGQALLGNGSEDAAIEFAEFGGRFQADISTFVALSGAQMDVKLNNTAVGWHQVLHLHAGDILEIGAATDGVYGYLHVSGGFRTERMLGSRSTHLRAGFGHILKSGQMLEIGDADRVVGVSGLANPDYFKRRTLRALWGPQSHYFDESERAKFAGAKFTVSKMRDRMGIQVAPDCGPIHSSAGLTIASDSISLGDIQITGDGTPAILLADRGPSGGYPRIATLATVDLPALAQIPTGESFRLQMVAREDAVKLLAGFRQEISGLSGKVKPMLRDPRDISDLLTYNLISGVTAGKPDEN
jgi:5-oxoprolinase (ATP-hydrolysing) subunit C